ncbi:hypothetical protein M9Y10_026748 [Tritrichomonas musculus]|uniref:Protein kinase domain-containing protein n=1 Tax=Tritrichomonas musculus TaxID=1915356 RepID=A0ABR2H6F1_9EUKA
MNTNDDSSIKIFTENDYIELRNCGSSSISSENLIFHIEKEELLIIKKKDIYDREYNILKEREYINYTKIKHPFIPNFYGITSKYEFLVIEFINGSTLSNIQKLNLQRKEKLTIIFELMIGIEYLHSNNFVYRDLKPSNVMIDVNKTVVLIDFDRMVPFDEQTNKGIHTRCFQSDYAAPEVIQGRYSLASDIYSLGQMMFYIMMNKMPTVENYYELKENDEFLYQLYQQCIKIDEKERPSIWQLIIEFYIEYHSCIQIENFFELYENKMTHCYDKDTINAMKNIFLNESDPETQFQIGKIFNDGKVVHCNYQKAFHYFKLAADQNHSDALFFVGSFYLDGKGVEQNYKHAKEYFELSADQQNDKALVCLGNLYYKGIGVEKDYKKAIKYYQLSAEQNNVEAIVCLGHSYYKGEGVEKDFVKSKEYFIKAAEQKNADAICALGLFYYYGYESPTNHVKARKLFEESAEQNYPLAFNYLGLIYIRGLDVEMNIEKGIKYLEQSAELKSDTASLNLGNIYYYGRGVKQDYEKGRFYYEKAIELGNIQACLAVGNLYFGGVGVEQSFLKAKEYYDKAAEQGDADAYNVIGYLYDTGKGVNKDYAKAKEYFEKAVKKDHPNACNSLGNIYLHGCGIPVDFDKARQLFEKSAKLGNSRGFYLLANLYFEGSGVERNYLQAIEYYEKALQGGFSTANYNLGDIYYKGLGVERNYQKAKEYFEKASDRRNTKASFQLGIMYFYGKGVQKDYEKAKEFFDKSSKEDDYNAFYYLAKIFEDGKGTEINLNKSIGYYKKCVEVQNKTLSVEYKQGWTHLNITNEKYYQSFNNLGLIYLLQYNDLTEAEKYLHEAGYSSIFPYGKNNYGVLNQFYLKNSTETLKMYESASKENFSISEFQIGYINEEKGEFEKAMENYENILKYENEPLNYKNNEIDDEQLLSSKLFIYCLSNLKLFQFFLNISDFDTINLSKYIVNAIFRPLLSHMFNSDYCSYSFKFIVEKNGDDFILLNLKDFLLNFPWYQNDMMNDSQTEWKIIEKNEKRKGIIIYFEERNRINLNDLIDSNNFDWHEHIKEIFNNININRNNMYKSVEITFQSSIENDEKNKTQSKEMLTTKKNDVNDSKNVNQKKLNNVKKSVDINDAELSKKFETKKDDGLLKKCVFHAAIDDVECYLEYPHCLVDMVTKNIRKLKDINNDIVINMTQILYKPPYPILFGRIGKTVKIIGNENQCNINGDFYDAFDNGGK